MDAERIDMATDASKKESLDDYALQLMRRLRNAPALTLLPGISRSSNPEALRQLIDALSREPDDLSAARYLLQQHSTGNRPAVAELEDLLLGMEEQDWPLLNEAGNVTDLLPAKRGQQAEPDPPAEPEAAESGLAPEVPKAAATATAPSTSPESAQIQELNDEIDALHREVSELRGRYTKARSAAQRDLLIFTVLGLLLCGYLAFRLFA